MSDRGDERVGDADRQRVIDALRAHTGAGRLTLDEFSDLCGAVFAARTRAELDAVVRDLPPGVGFDPAPAVPLRATPATPATPALPSVPAAGAPVPAHPDRTSRRWFVAIMSGARSPGRWRAARQMTALAFWGGVHMDLKGAEVEGSVVDITAWAIMGGVTIRVPPGCRSRSTASCSWAAPAITRVRPSRCRARRWSGSMPGGCGAGWRCGPPATGAAAAA
ncbi:MAG TPA: DUF1707 domain-containing protein, partial [Acidimicrobiales bacterium]